MGRYARGAAQPPSSDPASIYRSLHTAVSRKDEHNGDVVRPKDKLTSVALDLSTRSIISQQDAQEAAAYVNAAHISEWKPMIYVIPYPAVADRVLSVPRIVRASGAPEYIIADLSSQEFEAIEPMPCS